MTFMFIFLNFYFVYFNINIYHFLEFITVEIIFCNFYKFMTEWAT